MSDILKAINELNFNERQKDFILEQLEKVRLTTTDNIIKRAIELIYLYEDEDVYLAVVELENMLYMNDNITEKQTLSQEAIDKIINEMEVVTIENKEPIKNRRNIEN